MFTADVVCVCDHISITLNILITIQSMTIENIPLNYNLFLEIESVLSH